MGSNLCLVWLISALKLNSIFTESRVDKSVYDYEFPSSHQILISKTMNNTFYDFNISRFPRGAAEGCYHPRSTKS